MVNAQAEIMVMKNENDENYGNENDDGKDENDEKENETDEK